MLTLIVIRNFAIVEDLELALEGGLCLLTGETGAGKSILVEALGLLAGARADTEMVRSGTQEASFEGRFEPGQNREAVSALLSSWQIPFEEEIILRRRVQHGGRSSATVNGAGVSLTQLKELGVLLVQIHGQHQGQALLDEETHRRILDELPDVRPHAAATLEAHGRLSQALTRLKSLQRSEADRSQRLDTLNFQRQEIDKISPKEKEDEELEATLSRLQNAEKIVSSASALHALLRENETSVASQLAVSTRRLEELAAVDRAWEPFRKDLASAAGILATIASEAERTASTLAFDPEALERALSRAADLDKLKRKYGPALADVLAHRLHLEEEYRALSDGAASPEKARALVDECYGTFAAEAGKLSRARKAAADILAVAVETELKPLALEKARFLVELVPRPAREPQDAVPWGFEEVRFLFTANPGEPPKPLARIASGGELSRTLLALLTASKAHAGPETMVFDEVDSGIGGRPAEAVGRRLKSLGRHHQVLCVTHLPQIAAFAGHHVRIDKSTRAGRTQVGARTLDAKERLAEIARMLAGENVGRTALEHARELLRLASAPPG